MALTYMCPLLFQVDIRGTVVVVGPIDPVLELFLSCIIAVRIWSRMVKQHVDLPDSVAHDIPLVVLSLLIHPLDELIPHQRAQASPQKHVCSCLEALPD
jgi:hypothetical protein